MRRSLVLCWALLLGCGDGGSGPGAGTRYQLILVDDQPLPRLVTTFGLAGAQHLISAGELRLNGTSAFQQMQYMQKYTGAEPIVSFTDSASSAFTRDGARLIIVHRYGTLEVIDTGYVDGTLLILPQNLKNHLGQKTSARFTLKYEQQ